MIYIPRYFRENQKATRRVWMCYNGQDASYTVVQRNHEYKCVKLSHVFIVFIMQRLLMKNLQTHYFEFIFVFLNTGWVLRVLCCQNDPSTGQRPEKYEFSDYVK